MDAVFPVGWLLCTCMVVLLTTTLVVMEGARDERGMWCGARCTVAGLSFYPRPWAVCLVQPPSGIPRTFKPLLRPIWTPRHLFHSLNVLSRRGRSKPRRVQIRYTRVPQDDAED